MTATLKKVGRRSGDWPAGWRALGVVLVLGLLGLMGAIGLDAPREVAQVRLVNPAEFDIQLFVIAENGLWLRLPTAPAAAERTIQGVLDAGDEWTLHARSQGLDGGAWAVSRDELQADGWEIMIPEEVVQRLRDQGAPATPSPP